MFPDRLEIRKFRHVEGSQLRVLLTPSIRNNNCKEKVSPFCVFEYLLHRRGSVCPIMCLFGPTLVSDGGVSMIGNTDYGESSLS